MLDAILPVLPPSIRDVIAALPEEVRQRVEEIRIRENRPLEVVTAEGTGFVATGGRWGTRPERAYVPDREDCTKLLNLISQHSLYALEEELRRGYVTVDGGHRIGLAGKVVVENGKVKHLRDVTGFNIRLARQVKGTGKALIPYVFGPDHVENVLIVSPPQCGKTTLLRDLARIASVGERGVKPRKVGIVDERSEIAGCLRGVPQHDVGPRTDVLDACPKSEGMMMMIRSMSPEILVVDEIGRKEDSDAVYEAVFAGVNLFVTAHGRSLDEICRRPGLTGLIREGVFTRVVLLSRRLRPGTIEGIYDSSLKRVDRERSVRARC
ncbi:stage III sporulation protein AA [Polycladomyces abyssicola]|uniref:Stage III sporulation protein AA n=1 Tax=Polycladomyces abyssicola TaxID=1125966 RepID=A0A8D5ZN32_9BACL|nr:stage III sporulation protein AA [Polycladomyces abyssicola]